VLPLAIAALPMVLLYSSVRTFQELSRQRDIYLRNRVALLVTHLEHLSTETTPDALWEALSNDEPYLVDLKVFRQEGNADNPEVAAFWSGEELFRTESLRHDWGTLFRAYVPFHADGEMRVARIDLDEAVADFLLVHARHNVIVSLIGGVALVLLSIYSVWATRRAARLQVRQMEMEHLAHIGKMASVLAHEIRNPLGTIKGFAQLAAERTEAPVQELLRPVLTESQRLEALVNDLLAYGRPPSPDAKMISWSEVAGPLEAHARQMIGDRSIRFQIADAPLGWRTDPALLQQALLNLLRNAIEAIPAADGGEVRIEAEPADRGGVVLAVTDTGAGLDPAAAERLFEPFFTTKAFGTGLGLAITRKLVASLGGELTLEPRESGGTRAEIRFPKAELTEETHVG